MKKHSEDAAAKINLFLHITGKRPDGYHLLYSHVVFCPDIADRIVYKETKGNSFTFKVKGPYRDSAPADDSNLVVKTLKLFCEKFDLLLCGEITLYKNLPVGAGIGGGSSDAASAAVRVMRQRRSDFFHVFTR